MWTSITLIKRIKKNKDVKILTVFTAKPFYSVYTVLRLNTFGLFSSDRLETGKKLGQNEKRGEKN